jgi:hypothetical protein
VGLARFFAGPGMCEYPSAKTGVQKQPSGLVPLDSRFWRECRWSGVAGVAAHSARGNDAIDRTATIADHNVVLDDKPGLDDIDRHKAGAVPDDRVAAGLPGSEALQAQSRNPIARKIDLIETAPSVKPTETRRNIWYLWGTFYNSENRRGVIAPRLKAPNTGGAERPSLVRSHLFRRSSAGGCAGGITAAKLVGLSPWRLMRHLDQYRKPRRGKQPWP